MSSPLNHVAIIMDGNRRWARQKGLDPVKGHEAAVKQAIEPIIEHLANKKVPTSPWAFSTENWKRDEAKSKPF